MSLPRESDQRLDYRQVRAYWEAAAADAEAASYMAHEHGLPQECVEHRFALEQVVVGRWFAGLSEREAILDVGCGAGAWTEVFAQRGGRVVGIDASEGMLGAAAQRLASRDNVELMLGDARTVDLQGEFGGVFVGGLLMYLDRADAVELLVRLGALAPRGRIILRESGVRTGVEVGRGEYQVVYRSVREYEALAADAGLRVLAVERNRGYAHMEVAVAIVELLRRLPLLRRDSARGLGTTVWRALHATAPVSLDLVPRTIDALGVGWPHLTNHFLLLEKLAE
jgi:SAM-dependent methyltransferase